MTLHALVLTLLSGCSVRFYYTGVSDGSDLDSVLGTAPALASATITNGSPSTTTTYSLTYGTVTNSYSEYCIQENSTALASCLWQAGTLPASYVVTATEGPKVLSIWLRNAESQVSTRVDTATVPLRLTPLVATWALENDVSDDLVFSPELSKAGTVYYVVYDDSSATMTAEEVKGCATGSDAGCTAPLEMGTIAIPVANTPVPTAISGLSQYGLYRLHAVAEDAAGLAPDGDVMKYSAVLPRKISYESYSTAIAGKNSSTMRYVINLPQGYYDSDPTLWPVLVYISVDVNASNNSQAGFETAVLGSPFANRVLAGVDDYPLIQVSLTCSTKQSDGSFLFDCGAGTNRPYHDTDQYDEFVDELLSTYRIDPDRVYLAGASSGGGTVWRLLADYPEKFAAAVPMSIANIVGTPGFTYPTGATLCNMVAGMNQIAIWSIIHASDPSFTDEASVSTVTTEVNGCTGYSADARVTVLTGTAAANFPSSVNAHFTQELSFNLPFWNYSGATQTGGTKWYKANGTAAGTPDTNPIPSTLVPLHATLVTDLATASVDLGQTLDNLVEWMLLWEKP